MTRDDSTHRTAIALCVLALVFGVAGESRAQEASLLLVRTREEGPRGALAVDRGATGLWQRLQKLRTTASVLYTTGHPDDDEAGVLTLLSRGQGARTALLTLNRGEGGANALGPQLFDARGLIRSEELRDGHGHHQASGVLTPEAVLAASDPARFPEQITREGLEPWRVRKLYRGRIQGTEPTDLELNPYVTSAWLWSSYQSFGSYGLSLQRSQTVRTASSRDWT